MKGKVSKMFTKIQFDSEDVNKNKVVAAISNVPLLFWLLFVTDKNSSYIKHHANHGLWLLILEVINIIISKIPIVGMFISGIIGILILILAIYGVYTALQGEGRKWPLADDVQILK